MVIENNNKLGQKNWKPRVNYVSVVLLILSLILLTLAIGSKGSLAAVSNFERISVGTGGAQGNGESYYISLSEDGNVAVFESFASNWAPDQQGVNFTDIFVHDRVANTTIKISGINGTVADERSFDPIVSTDGRYVAFTSYATNLVPNDTNRHLFVDDGLDVFLYDRMTATLQRISLNWKGEQIEENSVGRITGDAKFLVFSSNGSDIVQSGENGAKLSAIYIRDLQTGAIERITEGPAGAFPNGGVGGAEPSYDGRYIVYLSDATNLVPDTNGQRDVMLYDSVTEQTTLISKPIGGGQSNGVSAPARITPDGRYIAFRSFATNMVPGGHQWQSRYLCL